MRRCLGFLLVGLCLHVNGCVTHPRNWVVLDTPDHIQSNDSFQGRVQRVLDAYEPDTAYLPIEVTYPYEAALFPPEISAPRIIWKDTSQKAKQWLLQFSFDGSRRVIYAITNQEKWHPDQSAWQIIKTRSLESEAQMLVLGIAPGQANPIVSSGGVKFSTSKDPVDAAILYRQVPLPFPKKFDKVRWRLGDISDARAPKIIMQKIGVCASCHIVSRDGRYLSMELNYGNDGGAQFIKEIEKNIVLKKEDFFSWNSFPRSGIIPETRGLFGKMSPSGRYVVASVNEISLALLTNEPGFSQVFFPTYGILAYYTKEEGLFRPLPGADDYAYVHANPNWRHDEQEIVFARAKIKNEVHDDITDTSPKYKDADIHALNRKYNIQFDLHTVPFRDGQGGSPKPLRGASQNGMSNYFGRYSPDGRWIVFTQSRTGIMLQPDADLYIIPSTGGTARRMRCNRARFNSWHSWSPNGKWLLFSSKVNTDFTEIFVTHIDQNGQDTPPVLLSQFSDPAYAANVPEFVNIQAADIDAITIE